MGAVLGQTGRSVAMVEAAGDECESVVKGGKWDRRGTDLNPQKRGINWMCRVKEGEEVWGDSSVVEPLTKKGGRGRTCFEIWKVEFWTL